MCSTTPYIVCRRVMTSTLTSPNMSFASNGQARLGNLHADGWRKGAGQHQCIRITYESK